MVVKLAVVPQKEARKVKSHVSDFLGLWEHVLNQLHLPDDEAVDFEPVEDLLVILKVGKEDLDWTIRNTLFNSANDVHTYGKEGIYHWGTCLLWQYIAALCQLIEQVLHGLL